MFVAIMFKDIIITLSIKIGKRTNSTNACCNYVQRYYHHALYKNKDQDQPPVPFPPCTIIWFLGDHIPGCAVRMRCVYCGFVPW